MVKLYVQPESAGYAVERGSEVLSVALDGGASKLRRDVLNASFKVNVSFVLDPTEYNYLNAFFRTATEHGSLPFEIDLILDNTTLTEYTARFVPDTFKLTAQKGLTYYVGAVLEVESLPDNATADQAIIDAYEELVAP